MKQKSWWADKIPEAKQRFYKYDYIVALVMHGFSWAFMITLPVVLYYKFSVTIPIFLSMIANAAIHAAVDHLKANTFKLNLVQDQIIHILQICITFAVLVLV